MYTEQRITNAYEKLYQEQYQSKTKAQLQILLIEAQEQYFNHYNKDYICIDESSTFEEVEEAIEFHTKYIQLQTKIMIIKRLLQYL
jgi:hypothetical protein